MYIINEWKDFLLDNCVYICVYNEWKSDELDCMTFNEWYGCMYVWMLINYYIFINANVFSVIRLTPILTNNMNVKIDWNSILGCSVNFMLDTFSGM